MIYIVTICLYIVLALKIDFFRKLFTNLFHSTTILEFIRRILVFLLVLFLIYFTLWSIWNYWFYINLYILHYKLGYGLYESIVIASKLTNELATGVYYIQLALQGILGNDMYNNIMRELQPQIDNILEAYGQISDIDSGFSALSEFSKILF